MLKECVTGTHKAPALNMPLEASSQCYSVQGQKQVDLDHFATEEHKWTLILCGVPVNDSGDKQEEC